MLKNSEITPVRKLTLEASLKLAQGVINKKPKNKKNIEIFNFVTLALGLGFETSGLLFIIKNIKISGKGIAIIVKNEIKIVLKTPKCLFSPNTFPIAMLVNKINIILNILKS